MTQQAILNQKNVLAAVSAVADSPLAGYYVATQEERRPGAKEVQ
jgi:hypothetical protein